MQKKVVKMIEQVKSNESSEFWLQFGLFIQQCRTRARLSVADVASYLGSSPEIVAKYEAGRQKVPLNIIYSLSNCLNIAPNTITAIMNAYPKFPNQDFS